jgi:amidophosphoribosyltransferase
VIDEKKLLFKQLRDLLEGLVHLQHRGQDAAGILTYQETDKNYFSLKKGKGLVRDIFKSNIFEQFTGNIGIGHVRYPTNGSSVDINNAQPFINSFPYGIAMVHNGNLSNYESVVNYLYEDRKVHCNTTSDLECLINLFGQKLATMDNSRSTFENLCEATDFVYEKAKGGYSVVGIINGHGMVAFRDPNGIRPLVIGKRVNEDNQVEYIFASETTMFYSLGFEIVNNVENGELVYIDLEGDIYRKKIRNEIFTPDAFEYIYFARPDAVLNNISVYRSRLRMGQNLANKWKQIYPYLKPDVVIPVPFSANTAALSMASELGVRYTEGIYKNPFIGRTFIMDNQDKRKKSVRQKLSPQNLEIRNKKVMVLDDSIVRGTTSKEVVEIIKDAGAKEVYFVSACPPLFYPDFYGISIPTQEELIASRMNIDELQEYLGVDALLFQDIEGLSEAILRKGDHKINKLSMPYFDADYVTKDIDLNQFKIIENFENIKYLV